MKWIVLILITAGCARNVDFVKAHAIDRWAELGYSSPVFEGYEWSLLCGGNVWYTIKRADSPGIIYSAYLCKWGSDLMFYGPRVVSGDQYQINTSHQGTKP